MSLSHTAADSHEIRALTGIRGFAAILVVMLHFYGSWVLLFPWWSLVERPVSRGGFGVDLFFILSGFILSYVYHVGKKKLTPREYGKFLWFRLARVYPNHLATLLVMVLLVIVAPMLGFSVTGVYTFQNLPFELTLTQSWPFNPNQATGEWNFPAWSISCEWFAYLAIFPLVALLLSRIQSSVLALFLGSGVLMVWPVFYNTLPSHLHRAAAHGLVHVSCEFFAGGMFFGVFLLGGGIVHFCQRFLSGLFFMLLVLFFAPYSYWVDAGILLVFPFLLIGLTSEVSLPARLLSTSPALWLGRVSYALYMSHGVALKFIKILLPVTPYTHSSPVLRALVILAHLMIVMAMATGLYYTVEIPARNYLRKFGYRGLVAVARPGPSAVS